MVPHAPPCERDSLASEGDSPHTFRINDLWTLARTSEDGSPLGRGPQSTLQGGRQFSDPSSIPIIPLHRGRLPRPFPLVTPPGSAGNRTIQLEPSKNSELRSTVMELKMTEKAAGEVKRMFEEKQLPETTALRVAVAAGGCSGFEYRLEFEENPDEQQDLVKEIHGVRVTVDKKSAEILGGTEIDFKEDMMSRSFVFNNPLAVRTCGCGNSFQ